MAFLSIFGTLGATAACLYLFLYSPNYGLAAILSAVSLALVLKQPDIPQRDYSADITYLSEEDRKKHSRKQS